MQLDDELAKQQLKRGAISFLMTNSREILMMICGNHTVLHQLTENSAAYVILAKAHSPAYPLTRYMPTYLSMFFSHLCRLYWSVSIISTNHIQRCSESTGIFCFFLSIFFGHSDLAKIVLKETSMAILSWISSELLFQRSHCKIILLSCRFKLTFNF